MQKSQEVKPLPHKPIFYEIRAHSTDFPILFSVSVQRIYYHKWIGLLRNIFPAAVYNHRQPF